VKLGLRLKTLRKAIGLTQQELADKVGVSRVYIQTLEANRRLPSMKLLERLAEALGVDVSELIQSQPAKGSNRMDLEELLEREDIEVWYRSRRLSPREIQLVQRLIEAAAEDWEAENDERKD
jgi:transcriptional regulator with XRE-family HTH domain